MKGMTWTYMWYLQLEGNEAGDAMRMALDDALTGRGQDRTQVNSDEWLLFQHPLRNLLMFRDTAPEAFKSMREHALKKIAEQLVAPSTSYPTSLSTYPPELKHWWNRTFGDHHFQRNLQIQRV